MNRPSRRGRQITTGVVVTAIAVGVTIGARQLPPDVRWAMLVVVTPYLLGGVLLVVLPVVAWIGGFLGSADDPVSRG